MVAEGDVVAARLTFRGTHAPHRPAGGVPEAIFVRFADGKATGSWEVTDTARSWTKPPWQRAPAGAQRAGGRRSVGPYEAHVIRQGCLSGPSRESVHRSLKTVSSSRLPDNTALVSRSST